MAKLSTEGGVTGTYANNEIGIHRVENRTDKLACTLHVYAPPLRRMRIFDEATGRVHAHLAASRSTAAAGDENYHGGGHGSRTFDIDAWNSYHKYFSLLDEGHGDGGHGYKGHGDGENEVGTGDGRSNGRGGGQPMSERHRNTC